LRTTRGYFHIGGASLQSPPPLHRIKQYPTDDDINLTFPNIDPTPAGIAAASGSTKNINAQ